MNRLSAALVTALATAVAMLLATPALAQWGDKINPGGSGGAGGTGGQTPAQPGAFAGLPECTGRVTGLPPGTREELTKLLGERVAHWTAEDFESLQPFDHPQQAALTLNCFRKRFALVAGYIPPDPTRDKALQAGNAIRKQWGDKLANFLDGKSPDAENPQWWAEADQAFGALIDFEAKLATALKSTEARKEALHGAESEIDLLADGLASVHAVQDRLDAQGRARALRELSWRARNAALALDRLQLEDLTNAPDDAFAYLVGKTAPKDEGESQLAPVGDLLPYLKYLRDLREARSSFNPQSALDLSQDGSRRTALEQLYMLNYLAGTHRRRVVEFQEQQAEYRRKQLDIDYSGDLVDGMTEAAATAKRDAAMQVFLKAQKQERADALARWKVAYAAMRQSLVQRGPTLKAP